MRIFAIFTHLFFFLAVFQVNAQTVIIAEDVRNDRDQREYGMNRRHYSHSWIGIRFVAGSPENQGADVYTGRSWAIEYGYRYKRRFSDIFSAGVELQANQYAFHMKQSDHKLVPDPLLHKKEKLVFLQTGLGMYQRINFDRRGDYIGRFLDIGVYGYWLPHVRHITHNETPEGERIRIRRTRMDYPHRFGYGVMARIGINNLVLSGRFRYSDLFTADSGLPELPRWSVGLEIGMHPF